jgi:benzoyl-CoA 2,3-dioxygenase component B
MTKFDANGREFVEDVPLRRAMNEVLRDAYVEDCEKAVRSWNRTLAAEGCDLEITLPNRRFHRGQGLYSEAKFDTRGQWLQASAWSARESEWLPTDADRAYVKSLMYAVTTPGEFAHWIAPPPRGIEGMPIEYEYVRFNEGSHFKKS